MLVENGSSSVEAMQQGAQPRIPSISQALQKESAEGKPIKKKKKCSSPKHSSNCTHYFACIFFFSFCTGSFPPPFFSFYRLSLLQGRLCNINLCSHLEMLSISQQLAQNPGPAGCLGLLVKKYSTGCPWSDVDAESRLQGVGG